MKNFPKCKEKGSFPKSKIKSLIKDRNSVANLLKMTIYDTNVDLVNVNVYTKFG